MATKTKKPPVKVTVPRLGIVRPPQSDLDVSGVRLQGKPFPTSIARAVTDMQIEQTIDGASTLTISVSDWNSALLRSQLLQGAVTVTFDGLSFTLVKVSAGQDAVTLTFEETAVNLLRQYSKPKKADRATSTRAQFVRSLITEVKEAQISYQIPEVNDRQPVAKG